jgi:hypothetical protein
MSLQLKIKLARTQKTTVMKFAPTMSVAECCKQIREKTEEGGEDHGLFQPAVEVRTNYIIIIHNIIGKNWRKMA